MMSTQEKKTTNESPSVHYETHFHGPVTGQVHTGSGDINRYEEATPAEQNLANATPTAPSTQLNTKQSWPRLFDMNSLRELLTISLTNSLLIDLCQSYFPTVYHDFAEGMTASQQRRLLLDHCERHHQLQLLVDHIKTINPERYRDYLPRLIKPVIDQLAAAKEATRIQAAQLLAQTHQPELLPIIEEQLFKQADPAVRYWLAIAIGKIGGNEAQATLQRITHHLAQKGSDPFTMLGLVDAKKILDLNEIGGGVQT